MHIKGTASGHQPRQGNGAAAAGASQSDLGGMPQFRANSTPSANSAAPDRPQIIRTQPILERMARWWVGEDSLAPADALLILAGDSSAGGRLKRAVELFQQGKAPLLILSGAPVRPYLSESQLMEQEARQAGVPPQSLVQVPHSGASTMEEAVCLLEAAAEAGARSLIVVSSSFHVRRVRAIYGAWARMLGFSVRVAAAEDPRFDPACWWRHRIGIVTLGLELLKSVLTWIELRPLAWRRSPPAGPASTPSLPRPSTGRLHLHRSHR